MTAIYDELVRVDEWPFEAARRWQTRQIARAFGVPVRVLRTAEFWSPVRERLEQMLDDMALGRRCLRCAGRLPMDTDEDDVCRCGSQWG